MYTFSSLVDPHLSHPKHTQAHCQYVVLKGFQKAIHSAGLSPSNLTAMRNLCALFAIFYLVKEAGQFMMVSN